MKASKVNDSGRDCSGYPAAMGDNQVNYTFQARSSNGKPGAEPGVKGHGHVIVLSDKFTAFVKKGSYFLESIVVRFISLRY